MERTPQQTVKERKEVLAEDKWNVETLYPNIEAWESAFNKIKEQPAAPYWPSLAKYRNRLQEGPKVVKEALEKVLSISRELDKLHTYAHLRHDEETTIDKHKSSYQRISALFSDFQHESAWMEPEFLALPAEKIESYLKSPELAPFRFHIEKLVRMRPHTLSIQAEEILAMASKPMQTSPKAFSAMNNADIKFNKIKDSQGQERELSHGLFQTYLRSPDRTLRENAFKGMHEQFYNFQNTLCELLYGEIQTHQFSAKARNYSSSLEAALFPKKIPQEVYRSLITAVRKGLGSLHRYIKIRKKMLGLSELHLYDMYVPLVSQVEIKMKYPEAEQLVIDSVAPLGSEYQNLLRKGMQSDRWVDRYENKNKRSGAYSSGCYDSSPYILMNYRGILRDVFTLAHEAGHSMHSLLSHKTQPYQYSHYPIFVAEVASTFNEELLMHHLLKKTSKKEERLFLINEKIEDIRATLFRQTMFAEFELKIHELVEADTPLTPDLLKKIYLELNRDYFGPDAVVDSEIAIEWARIPHFYYNFYVYQYATGISAALSLAEKVLAGDVKARDAYLSFLKGGGSLFPIDLLKMAGIDMTSSKPVEAALRRFDSLVDELEKAL